MNIYKKGYFILASSLKKCACGFRRCWQVFNALLHSSGRVLVENLQKFWVPKGGNRFHFNSFLRSGKVRVLDAHSCSFVGIFNCLLFCFGFRGLPVGWSERVGLSPSLARPRLAPAPNSLLARASSCFGVGLVVVPIPEKASFWGSTNLYLEKISIRGPDGP